MILPAHNRPDSVAPSLHDTQDDLSVPSLGALQHYII